MKKYILVFLAAGLFVQSCGTGKMNKSKVKDSAEEQVVDYEDALEEEEIEEVVANVYRETETIYTDLVHTKLEVNFDWSKSRMNGKAYITAKPHFYSTDSIVLDAKGMEILKVQMNGKDLLFKYDSEFLTVNLGRSYTRDEKYTVEITYVAKPDERVTSGSAAITSDKGLYFINPRGEEQNKMPHIWTQGETEASSVWFPTIDAPNVKTSQEIFMTVQDKYATLSNGKFMGSKKNVNGTRTDHWKQELQHAPYLFMMAVGEFSVVEDFVLRKDGSKMPVNYYVEKEWAQYAKDIFGETPSMIRFFSDLLKVEYPWDKYHQIIVRDYVSGAMENTGAVIFGEYAYKTKRELLDDNDNSTIAHELFHHWFGDLVTAESWSNLTLNESFANYSQYLWDEHRYGLDEADYQAQKEADGYFQSSQMSGYHNLVWFDYKDKEQMFDGHSYNKGGRILHMLRNYLGDEAFFEGISRYLKTNSFKAAEFHQLRLAFEEVSGKDLNFFFNQWYLGSGHPILDVSQAFNPETKMVGISVSQKQDLKIFPMFKLPVDIAIHDANGKTVHEVMMSTLDTTFMLPVTGDLKCVIFDDQQMLLAKIRETKPQEQYVFQYYNGGRYAAREAALKNGLKAGNIISEKLILDALNDEFWKIRTMAIDKASTMTGENKTKVMQIIKNLAVNDGKSQVRAAAITYLAANMQGEELTKLLAITIDKDPSYLVVGTALKGLGKIEPEKAMASAKKLEGEPSSKMVSVIAQLYGNFGTVDQADFFKKALLGNTLSGFDQVVSMNSFTLFNSRLSVKDLKSSLEVYEYLSENGGYYTKMFMSRNIDYLMGSLEEQKETLNTEIVAFEKNKDVALADQNRLKIKEIDSLQESLQATIKTEE
jgi:aminopeptidase N